MYYGAVGRVPVVSNRADVVGHLTDAGLSDSRLASQLLVEGPPLASLFQPMWESVSCVQPGERLAVSARGQVELQKYWHLQFGRSSLHDGALQFRHRLKRAIEARVSCSQKLGCDLSGGLDSTPLAHLASKMTSGMIALTTDSEQPEDNDLEWALRAIRHMPDAEHVVLPGSTLPPLYADVLSSRRLTDAPSRLLADAGRQCARFDELRTLGVEIQMNGIGGDNLLWLLPICLVPGFRSSPLRALRHLVDFKALYGWKASSVAGALLHHRSQPSWSRRVIRELDAPRPALGSAHSLDWMVPPRMPPWASRDALEAVRQVLADDQSSSEAERHRWGRAEYAMTTAIQMIASHARLYSQIAETRGVRASSPYFDDLVMSAALGVRPQEVVSAREYKPLMRSAMRGEMDQAILDRTAKAAAGDSPVHDLKQSLPDLRTLLLDGSLVARGLVARPYLEHCLQEDRVEAIAHGLIDPTIGCEVWLRSLVAGAIL